MKMRFLLSLILCLSANLIASENVKTLMIEFGVENQEKNFFVIQPKAPISDTFNYSICLRIQFWTNQDIMFFSSDTYSLEFISSSKILKFYAKGRATHFINNPPWKQQAIQWNTVCIVQNNSNLMVMINSLESYNQTTKMTKINVYQPIYIGGSESVSRFPGIITDFNVWSQPLSKDQVQEFSTECSGNLTAR